VKSFLIPAILCALVACSSPAPMTADDRAPIAADGVTLFLAGLACPN
jgi:hypothetical protein